ncbi:hypothetical protein WSM22_26620 [Cytophagales bacterium WSM2-2]|nr:hypothetical protein WSM22_26620 [Cytophagales bacterium WSM2-2]
MNSKSHKFSVTLLFACISLGCLSQNKLAGYYASSTAQSGFFVTRIELNEDFSFKYEFDGEVAYHCGKGKYTIDDRSFVHFQFESNKLDSGARTAKLLFGDFSRPKKLLAKDEKLFFVSADDKILDEFSLKRIKGKRLVLRGEGAATK